jgi:hypothetical protein
MELESQYLATKNQIKELRKNIKKQAKDFFSDASKGLFESYPELISFRWTQYTPYFNDGDPCVFSANTEYPYLNGSDDEFFSSKDEPLNKAGKAVIKLLKTFEDEDYEMMFGDHCQVTVTRNGIDVEEYEHE